MEKKEGKIAVNQRHDGFVGKRRLETIDVVPSAALSE